MFLSGNSDVRSALYKKKLRSINDDIFNPLKLNSKTLNGIYYIDDIDSIKKLIGLEFDTEIETKGLKGFLEVEVLNSYTSLSDELEDVSDIITFYSDDFNHVSDDESEMDTPLYPANEGLQDIYSTYTDDPVKSVNVENITKLVQENKVEEVKEISKYDKKYGYIKNINKKMNPILNEWELIGDEDSIKEPDKEQTILIKYNLKLSNGYEYESYLIYDDILFNQFIVDTYDLGTVDGIKRISSYLLSGKFIKNAKIVFLKNDKDFTNILKGYVSNGVLNTSKRIEELKGVRPYLKLFFLTVHVPIVDYWKILTTANASYSGALGISTNEYRNNLFQVETKYIRITDLYTPEKNEIDKFFYAMGDLEYCIDPDLIITRGAIYDGKEWWDPTSFESPFRKYPNTLINTPTDFKLINGELQFTYNNQFPVSGLPYGNILEIEANSDNNNLNYDVGKYIGRISGENTYYFVSDYLNHLDKFKTRFKLEFKGIKSPTDVKVANHYFEYGSNFSMDPPYGRNNLYLFNTLTKPLHEVAVELGFPTVENKIWESFLHRAIVREYNRDNNGWYFYKYHYNDFITMSYDTINFIQAEAIRQGDKLISGRRELDYYNNADLDAISENQHTELGIMVANNIRPATDLKEFNHLKQRRVNKTPKKTFDAQWGSGGYYLYKDARHFNEEVFQFDIPGFSFENYSGIQSMNGVNDRNGWERFDMDINSFIHRYFDYFPHLSRYIMTIARNGVFYQYNESETNIQYTTYKTHSWDFGSYFYSKRGKVIIHRGTELQKRQTFGSYPTKFRNIYVTNNSNAVRLENNDQFRTGYIVQYGNPSFSYTNYLVRVARGRTINKKSRLSFTHPVKDARFY